MRSAAARVWEVDRSAKALSRVTPEVFRGGLPPWVLEEVQEGVPWRVFEELRGRCSSWLT